MGFRRRILVIFVVSAFHASLSISLLQPLYHLRHFLVYINTSPNLSLFVKRKYKELEVLKVQASDPVLRCYTKRRYRRTKRMALLYQNFYRNFDHKLS